MLRSIDMWVAQSPEVVKNALSIDINPDLDSILLARWPALRIERAVMPEADAMELKDFGDGRYDLVYSHQVLEHIAKPWRAASEMVRVLRAGGIGIHTSCAFNPRHGPPQFNDYYRFLVDGLAELFEGVSVLEKGEWGNREAILHNVSVDDGHGSLGGRRFPEHIGLKNDHLYPWHTWIIFKKN